jgi:hypothetical protein
MSQIEEQTLEQLNQYLDSLMQKFDRLVEKITQTPVPEQPVAVQEDNIAPSQDQSIIETVEQPNGDWTTNQMFIPEAPTELVQQQGGNPVLELSDDEAEFKLE